jgi:hypothetical protein
MRFYYRIIFVIVLSFIGVFFTHTSTVSAANGAATATIKLAIEPADGGTSYGPVVIELQKWVETGGADAEYQLTDATVTTDLGSKVPDKDSAFINFQHTFDNLEPIYSYRVCLVGTGNYCSDKVALINGDNIDLNLTENDANIAESSYNQGKFTGPIDVTVNITGLPDTAEETDYGPIGLALSTRLSNGPDKLVAKVDTNTFKAPKHATSITLQSTPPFEAFKYEKEAAPEGFIICVTGATVGACGTDWPINWNDKNVTYNITLTYDEYTQALAAHKKATSDAGKTSCAINGVGWIVCPVVNFLAQVADGAFAYLSDNFLKTNPDTVSVGSPTYVAWSSMRNIANVAFVLAFLMIIYSQITSVGITNYGVKKILPRLVIAAILVNISYFVCQIAVDLSNIIGFSLKDLITSVPIASGGAPSGWSTGVGFLGIAGTVLAGGALGAIVWVTLAALVPILIASVIALITILFILVTRQALIILLVVISPLAFVCFLLPNTAPLFTKWRKTFTAMLLLFPIIALVFGASTLASKVLQATYINTAAGTYSGLGQIIAAAVMILPLFIVPGLLKKSLDSMGSIGTKINSLGDKAGSALGKKGSDAYGNSRLAQYKNYRADEKNKRRALIQSGQYEGSAGFLWNRSLGNKINKRINEGSGDFGRKSAAKGVQLVSKITNDEFNEAETLLKAQGTPESLVGEPRSAVEKRGEQYQEGRAEKALREAVKTGNTAGARAAQKVLLEGGDVGRDKLHNVLRSLTATADQDLNASGNRSMLSSMKRDLNSAGLKGSNNALATFSYTEKPLGSIENDIKTYDGLSDEQLAGQSAEALGRAKNAGAISDEKAYNMMSNQNVFKSLSESQKEILAPLAASHMSSITPPPPLPGPEIRRRSR